MSRRLHPVLTLIVCVGVSACSGLEPARITDGRRVPGNPIFVRANNDEVVWERAVDVVHDYQFEILRENRLDGILETKPKVGSGLFEPWQRETLGFNNRLESTLQSIRRRAIITVTPQEGGFLVGVEALKERENVLGVAENAQGQASFPENAELQRDLNLVVGQSAPSGWIPLGRDPILEESIICRLRQAFSR